MKYLALILLAAPLLILSGCESAADIQGASEKEEIEKVNPLEKAKADLYGELGITEEELDAKLKKPNSLPSVPLPPTLPGIDSQE